MEPTYELLQTQITTGKPLPHRRPLSSILPKEFRDWVADPQEVGYFRDVFGHEWICEACRKVPGKRRHALFCPRSKNYAMTKDEQQDKLRMGRLSSRLQSSSAEPNQQLLTEIVVSGVCCWCSRCCILSDPFFYMFSIQQKVDSSLTNSSTRSPSEASGSGSASISSNNTKFDSVILYLADLVDRNQVSSMVGDHECMVDLLLHLLRQLSIPTPYRLIWDDGIERRDGVPFALQVLCILLLSSSTTDQQTIRAGLALVNHEQFSLEWLLGVPDAELECMIMSAGRYKSNRKHLKGMAACIHQNFAGEVPTTLPELMTLPGVGPKIGILTIKTCFSGTPGIGTDVHIVTFAVGMEYAPWSFGRDHELVHVCLEGWVPKAFWYEFNEVYGSLGQLFAQKATTDIIKRTLNKPQFAPVKERVLRILHDYRKRGSENLVDTNWVKCKMTMKVNM